MTELKDIVVTIKQRGKSGRWLKAKSYKATEFVSIITSDIKQVTFDGKLSWHDKTFKTKKYMDSKMVNMYNLGALDTMGRIIEKFKKIKK
jgi:hypothetical protein